MKKREIGKSGIKVNPFAFGGNLLTWDLISLILPTFILPGNPVIKAANQKQLLAIGSKKAASASR